MTKRLSNEKIERIKKLANEGLSRKIISKRLNISLFTVQKYREKPIRNREKK